MFCQQFSGSALIGFRIGRGPIQQRVVPRWNTSASNSCSISDGVNSALTLGGVRQLKMCVRHPARPQHPVRILGLCVPVGGCPTPVIGCTTPTRPYPIPHRVDSTQNRVASNLHHPGILLASRGSAWRVWVCPNPQCPFNIARVGYTENMVGHTVRHLFTLLRILGMHGEFLRVLPGQYVIQVTENQGDYAQAILAVD